MSLEETPEPKAGRVGQGEEGLGHSSQEGKGKREQARRLSFGKPSKSRRKHASFGSWRPWLDAVLTSAAKNSLLPQLTASATADNLQFSRRVLLHQQFLFPRGGATVMVALHWLRAGGRRTQLLTNRPAFKFFGSALPMGA